MERAVLHCATLVLILSASAWAEPVPNAKPATDESKYVQAVRTFADNVLTYGRDTYRNTPLLMDGVNVDTHEPPIWRLPAACALVWGMPKRSVMCNVASQQNLFRTLDGLSTATGDPRYRQAASDAMGYTFKHLSHRSGLLYWGGHCMVDLITGKPVGESHKDWTKQVPVPATWETGLVHELKHHYPYYEMMWQVDPKATRKFIEAFWGTHIQNWANLDMNRHGYFTMGAGPGWDHEYVGGPVPFKGKGLSFLHTGSDLLYAASMLTLLSDDERPLTWAKRLAQRYADIRHPVTKLGPEIYNHYRHDRFLAQFGPEWGKRVTETTIASVYGSRYSTGALCLLKIAEQLGHRGEEFKQLAIEDLTAFAKYAYDPSDNTFRAMLTDGTIMTPEMVKRPGPAGEDMFRKRGAGIVCFWAYALGAYDGNDPLLNETARNIGKRIELGDIGNLRQQSQQPPQLKLETSIKDPCAIFALLDLHHRTHRGEYLELARRIGDNILAQEFHHGFFVPGKESLYVKFNTISPLALLHLDAALNQRSEPMPVYLGGNSYFHCDYKGKGRSYDQVEIYYLGRKTVSAPSTQPAAQK